MEQEFLNKQTVLQDSRMLCDAVWDLFFFVKRNKIENHSIIVILRIKITNIKHERSKSNVYICQRKPMLLICGDCISV